MCTSAIISREFCRIICDVHSEVSSIASHIFLALCTHNLRLFPAIPLPGSHCLWLPLAIRDRRTNKAHSVLALALRWWGELRCLAATLYLRLQSPYHRRIFLPYSSFYRNSRSDPTLFVNVCIVSHPSPSLVAFLSTAPAQRRNYRSPGPAKRADSEEKRAHCLT